MKFQGRHIDPVALWSDYVEFPANFSVDNDDEFTPLVQCPNPDHNTTKRHFQINLNKPLVHCFAGCGISGTYEHAISMIEGVKPREARRTILRHSRLTPVVKKRKRQGAATAISSDELQYDRFLPPVAMEYMEGRGITASSIARWEIGWDADQRRVVIPIKDAKSRTRMLVKRAIFEKQQPKYLYTEGVERNSLLFGACQIDLGMIRSIGIILVEGSIDTIMQHQGGYPNTVGILGSKLSEFQAKQIMNMRPKRVYTMFDPDAAGVSATISVIDRLSKMPISVVRMPRNTDPAELTSDQRERALRRAVTSLKFMQAVGHHTTRSNHRKGISVG